MVFNKKKMKFDIIMYILMITLFLVLLFQIKVPFCYEVPEKQPVTFAIYEEEVVSTIKQDIKETLFYFMKINGHSMEPTIKHNQACLCVEAETYKEKDIVSFYVPAEEGKIELIAHRVVRKEDNLFYTKGDNNPVGDDWVIKKDQIFCKIPETSIFDKFKFAILNEEYKIFK